MSNIQEVAAELRLELAQELLRRVKSEKATAADLKEARQFLVDNGANDPLRSPAPLRNLADELPFVPQEQTG